MKTIGVVVVFVVVFSVKASGTSVVAIWRENQVTIVADSKQTITGGSGVTTSQEACNVYQVRDTVFALAGLAKIEEIDVVNEIMNSPPMRDMRTGQILPIESIIVRASAAVTKVLNLPALAFHDDDFKTIVVV